MGLKLVLIALLWFLVAVNGQQQPQQDDELSNCPQTRAQKSFNKSKFTGKWFLVEAVPSGGDPLNCTTVTLSKRFFNGLTYLEEGVDAQ